MGLGVTALYKLFDTPLTYNDEKEKLRLKKARLLHRLLLTNPDKKGVIGGLPSIVRGYEGGKTFFIVLLSTVIMIIKKLNL